MALNLPKKPKQNFWDKVRDTFDANTEADQQRRLAQGKPQMYKDEVAQRKGVLPKLYGQQQVGLQNDVGTLKNAWRTGESKAGALTEFALNRTKGSILGVPGMVATGISGAANKSKGFQQGLESIGRPLVNNFAPQNALNNYKLLAGNTARVFRPNDPRSQRMVDEAMRGLKSGQEYNQYIDENTKSLNPYVKGGLNAGGMMLSNLVTPLAGANSTAGQTTKVAIESGASPTKAMIAGYGTGIVDYLGNKASTGSLLKTPGKNFAQRTLTRAVTGGADNLLDQFSRNLIAQKTYNPDQKLSQDLLTSIATGAGMNTVAGSIGDALTRQPKTSNTSLTKADVDISAIKDSTEPVIRTYKNNEANGMSPNNPVQKRLLEVYNRNMDAIRSLQKNQGGTLGDNPNTPTIKNVFGEEVPNPAYKAPLANDAPQVGKTLPKVKQVAQGKPPITLPEKPKVNLKNPELEALNTDTAIRQMSSIMGENIGQQSTELGAANKAISAVTGGRMTNLRQGNIARTASEAASKRLTEATEASITGEGNKALTGARSVFAGAGLADETKQIGRARTGKLANVEDLVKRAKEKVTAVLDASPESRQALDLVMRDKKYIDRVYPGAKKLSPDSLSPELRQVHDQLIAINKLVNDINYKTGVISKEQWMGGRKGQHIGRIFDIPKDEKQMIRDTIGSMFEASPGIKRKDISKFTDDVIAALDKDPAKAILIRQEIALRNLALQESMDAYAGRGFIKKSSPNDQYIKVTGKRFGKYDGQFMERTVYEELTNSRVFKGNFTQSVSDLMTKYKGTLVGSTDQLLKSFKTSMSPGTILGNVMSNIVAFTPGAGTNPLTQTFDMINAARKMGKGLADADVFEARQLGVIGGDTGKQMIGQTQGGALTEQSKNIFKRVHSRLGEFYGGIDDAAKLGLWSRLKKQGLSPQDAALEVAKFTQDYNNVGRAVTLIADTPVLGKPFARFAPELVRIMKNNATRSPQTVIAGVGLLALINNRLSKASGETEEERKAREEAVGQTMIPGTAWVNKLAGGPDRDISLNIPMGDTAVNIARAVGLNFPIEPGGDPTKALVESLIPFEIPTRTNEIGETEFDPTKVVTSMTARPLVEQALDQNFMGKKITDPSNTQYDTEGNVMKFAPPSAEKQRENRAKAATVAYLPMGNEIDAFWSAARGEPTVTGKERTLKEAVLRSVGVKTESNKPEDRQRRVDIQEYFEVDKEAENKFLRNNKDLEQLYFSVKPKTKDRETGVKLSDQISPEKWTKIKGDTSGRLFNFLKDEALRKEQQNPNQAADPIFKLPTQEQTNIVLDLRSRPTGDDIEAEEILRATQPWYVNFEKAERDYYAKSSAFFDSLGLPDTQNQRAKDYANIPYPEQSPLVTQYYAIKSQDPEAGKQFFKNNADALSSAFDTYKAERLKYINAKRKIEGYDPIDENTFNNVTFGYEDDERKVYNELAYGKGYGGYGGSKGVTKSYLKGPEQVATVKGKITLQSNKPKVKKFAVAKPKVTIKKSQV